MAEQSLKSKTIKGVGWSAADAFLGQGVTFVVGIVLARLLSPEEYGLIGLCVIINTILEGFIDSGFSTSIIRKKDATNMDYNTMFIVNMLISIVLYIALFFFSPLISTFFDRPELADLIKVTGAVLLINALSLTQNTILTKRLNFKEKTKASLVSAILSGILGIYMAYAGFGVWALVAQLVSRSLINTIALWIINRWWPNFSFSIESLKYMWGFGWKMLVSGLLDRIWNEAYQTVVGKFYNPATLGQYTRAKQYASIFSQNINSIVMRVSFPVLSSIQDDEQRMVSAYRRIIKITMFVTAVTMLTLASVSEPLIRVLIGDKWLQAASFLPLICISMSFYPLHAINLNMLKVMGRSDLFLKYEVLKKIIAIIPIAFGIFVGIYPMLVGSIFVGLVSFFINSWYTGKKLGYTSWMQLKDIAPSYLLAFTMAVIIFPIKYVIPNCYIAIGVQVLVGIILFFIFVKITKNNEFMELMELAKPAINKIRRR